MGSSLSISETEVLADQTIFESEQIRKWYRTFRSTRRGKAISKKEFVDENLSFSKFGDEKFWENMYNLADVHSQGYITFHEWLVILSSLSHGNIQSKMRFIFHVLAGEEEAISREELQKFIGFICEKRKRMSAIELNRIFMRINTDSDEKITMDAFTAFLTNTTLSNSMDITRLVRSSIFHVGTSSSRASGGKPTKAQKAEA